MCARGCCRIISRFFPRSFLVISVRHSLFIVFEIARTLLRPSTVWLTVFTYFNVYENSTSNYILSVYGIQSAYSKVNLDCTCVYINAWIDNARTEKTKWTGTQSRNNAVQFLTSTNGTEWSIIQHMHTISYLLSGTKRTIASTKLRTE